MLELVTCDSYAKDRLVFTSKGYLCLHLIPIWRASIKQTKKKKQKITSVGENEEKMDPLYTVVWENKMVNPPWETSGSGDVLEPMPHGYQRKLYTQKN